MVAKGVQNWVTEVVQEICEPNQIFGFLIFECMIQNLCKLKSKYHDNYQESVTKNADCHW